MFGVFTLAIKFDCIFGIFKSFHWFVTLIFDKLAPPEYMFQKMLKSPFSPFQRKKQSQKS